MAVIEKAPAKPAAKFTCDDCIKKQSCKNYYDNENMRMVRCTDWTNHNKKETKK